MSRELISRLESALERVQGMGRAPLPWEVIEVLKEQQNKTG